MAIMQIWMATLAREGGREEGRGVFYRDRFHDAADIWQRRERAGRRKQKVSAVQFIICIYAR